MPGDRFDLVRVNPRRVTVGAETTPSSISPTVAGARLAPLWFSNSSVPSSSPPARLAVLVGVVDEQYRHRVGRERLDARCRSCGQFKWSGDGHWLGRRRNRCIGHRPPRVFLPKAQRADGHDWQSQLRTLNLVWHSRCDLRRRRDGASTAWPVSCGAHRQNGAAGGHRMALARARSGASDHPASDQLVHVVYSRRGAPSPTHQLLLTEELARQGQRRATSDLERYATRVG